MSGGDQWAFWLRQRRHGGDEAYRDAILEHLGAVRDRVLDNAGISDGETVLDVGCGDGLVGFGALARVGERGRVILSDVSEELLETCREIAAGDARCEFARGSATQLPLPDASVDVVMTRSVLIYVDEKEHAFGELHRVLRPGGRLSIFEPINSFAYPQPRERFGFFDVGAVAELADEIRAHWRRRFGEDTLGGFDERDLVRWAEEAGFAEVSLDLEIRVGPAKLVPTWEAYVDSSPNPLAQTLREAVADALSPEEAERFLTHLRGELEAGRGIDRSAAAFLWAVRA